VSHVHRYKKSIIPIGVSNYMKVFVANDHWHDRKKNATPVAHAVLSMVHARAWQWGCVSGNLGTDKLW
jgi:hypothetical protein